MARGRVLFKYLSSCLVCNKEKNHMLMDKRNNCENVQKIITKTVHLYKDGVF